MYCAYIGFCGDNIIMLELYWKIFEDGRKFSLSRKRFYDGKISQCLHIL
jgi:hypothetical protein